MLPQGIKLFWGFLGLYLGLVFFIGINAAIYVHYGYVPGTTFFDSMIDLSIFLMLAAPLWFWVGRPIYFRFKERGKKDLKEEKGF